MIRTISENRIIEIAFKNLSKAWRKNLVGFGEVAQVLGRFWDNTHAGECEGNIWSAGESWRQGRISAGCQEGS
jgi:hypothetical protein